MTRQDGGDRGSCRDLVRRASVHGNQCRTDRSGAHHPVLSGAPYGIDGMAHRATLASGGNTIAVLAGGLDQYYPSGHDGLLQRVAETGAIVTEMPLRAAPTKVEVPAAQPAGIRPGRRRGLRFRTVAGRMVTGGDPGQQRAVREKPSGGRGCRPAEWSLDRTDAGGPGRAGTRWRCGASGARLGTDQRGNLHASQRPVTLGIPRPLSLPSSARRRLNLPAWRRRASVECAAGSSRGALSPVDPRSIRAVIRDAWRRLTSEESGPVAEP